MNAEEKKTTYFSEPGKQNTDALLKAVKEYASKEKITDVVVASTTGETGAKAAKLFKDCNVVVVTHAFGFQEPGKTELMEEYRQEILASGAKLFTGTHALSREERAIRKDCEQIQTCTFMSNACGGEG